MNCKLVIAVAVLAFVALAEAQRGRKGRPGHGGFQELRTPPEGDHYKWTRQLDAETTVREGAFVPSGEQLVIVRSGDRGLRATGYNASATFYDFNNSSPLAVVSLGPACFVIDSSLTYEGMVSELAIRNDTVVTTVLPVVTLDGTAEPLTEAEVDALLANNPALRRPCRGPIIATAAPGASTVTPSEELNLITFDSNIKLTVRERPSRPSPGPGGFEGFGGRGGGRGGRGGRRG